MLQRRLAIRFLVIAVLVVIALVRNTFFAPNPDNNSIDNGAASAAPQTELPAERDTLEITAPIQTDQLGNAKTESAAEESDGEFLTSIGTNRYRSPAGLFYGPGSADRDRLSHVLRHLKDEPLKEIHGVFDGNKDTVVRLLDEVYLATKNGGKNARSSRQNDRTAHTVFLDRRIGYVGGRAGQRNRNPVCEYVKLVLEDGNAVVTAFPVESF